MNTWTAGIVAGLIATIVISVLMVLKGMMGLGDFNAIEANAGLVMEYAGTGGAVAGWVLHFVIGAIVWGLLYVALKDKLPGDSGLVRGLVFGVIAWVLMMVIPMPLAGAGWFGLNIGIAAPVATLVLHIIFGAVLGATYARLWAGAAVPMERS